MGSVEHQLHELESAFTRKLDTASVSEIADLATLSLVRVLEVAKKLARENAELRAR